MRASADIISDLKEIQETQEFLQSPHAIEDAIELLETFSRIFASAFPEKSGAYFICGGSPVETQDGLPDRIFVCPAYGADVQMTTIYKKEPYSSGRRPPEKPHSSGRRASPGGEPFGSP